MLIVNFVKETVFSISCLEHYTGREVNELQITEQL